MPLPIALGDPDVASSALLHLSQVEFGLIHSSHSLIPVHIISSSSAVIIGDGNYSRLGMTVISSESIDFTGTTIFSVLKTGDLDTPQVCSVLGFVVYVYTCFTVGEFVCSRF